MLSSKRVAAHTCCRRADPQLNTQTRRCHLHRLSGTAVRALPSPPPPPPPAIRTISLCGGEPSPAHSSSRSWNHLRTLRCHRDFPLAPGSSGNPVPNLLANSVLVVTVWAKPLFRHGSRPSAENRVGAITSRGTDRLYPWGCIRLWSYWGFCLVIMFVQRISDLQLAGRAAQTWPEPPDARGKFIAIINGVNNR